MTNLKKCRILPLLFLAFLLLLAVSCQQDSGDEEDPCAHELTEWIIDQSATCATEGSKHEECVSCKKALKTVAVEKIAHTEEILAGTTPTCKQSGLSAGKICSVCQTVLTEQTELPAIKHTEQIVPGKKPTCTSTGLTDGKKCAVCNTVLLAQETVAKLEHLESDWIVDTVATVDATGSKHTECIRCQEPLQTEIISTVPASHVHEGAEWVTVKYATCTETGTKQQICICGQTVATETVDLLPHTEEKLLGIAATCVSTGLTDGKRCAVCEKILVSQITIAKTVHAEEPVLGKTPTCTKAGTTDGKKCSFCTTVTVAQKPLPPMGHTFEKGSCTDCGIAEPYGLWIVDGQGNPMTDIFVKILKDGQQVKLYPYQGEFLSMDLDIGTYQIELDLSQLSEEYRYDQTLCVLTPEQRTVSIRLTRTVTSSTTVFVGSPIESDYTAYHVGEGAYEVTLTPNDYTFFIFTPQTAAIYTLTYECDSNLSIGYHGSSFFVQGVDLSEGSTDIAKYENGLSVNVYSTNLGGDMVFAVKSTSATSCILNIKNAGNPGTRLEDEPWNAYLEDAGKVQEHLSVKPEGTYTEVDLTDLTLCAVFNEADSYYHLGSANGPILFIDLTSSNLFISSIQTICANQRMGIYIYDANGNIVEKRSYNELYYQYGMPDNSDTLVEEPIRVPLTAKLAESIQSFGDRNNWWAEGSETNLFTKALLGAPYNREFAWLLFCGYYN